MLRKLEYTPFTVGSYAYIIGYNHSIDPKISSKQQAFADNPKGMRDYEQGWADGQGDLELADEGEL